MRYLVFGDVHANLVGLKAVLAEADRRRIDAYLFVGDLVGYGPRPLECLAELAALYRQERLAWVAGNHDLAVRGDQTTERFSVEARETLDWTRSEIEKEGWAMQLIAVPGLLAKVSGGIWLTHDSLADPASGQYHRATEDAQAELNDLARRGGHVCFYGHTHKLRAELLTGSTVSLAPMVPSTNGEDDPAPLMLQAGECAWVGTGSAGFPTRQKGEAEYLVVDDTDWTVEKYAVAFSREAAREDLQAVLGAVCSDSTVTRLARWL